MTSVTLRWAGPSDAGSGSTYKVERTSDNANWTTLAASQAATSPYASHTATLSGNASYGDATISLSSASAFASAGYMCLDDAVIQWTGKSTNNLTGCIWHSGYGTYANGSIVYETHESYADTVTITLNAVCYRVTHTVGGVPSAPAYFWYLDPPQPESSQHCVVIVNVAADLGVISQADVTVNGYFASDNQFANGAGQHLDANAVAANSATTNAFGLAFFHCWKNAARSGVNDAADSAYTFVLKRGTGELIVSVPTIPDRDWVLLSQVAA